MNSKNKTVFISGKFKVIHSGHIRLFMYAKTIGNRLVVGLDSDGLDSSELLWREEFLSNQEFVDDVIIFDGDVAKSILELRPDVVLKGSEFEPQFNLEAEAVNQYGGQLIFSSGSTHFSEADLINKKDDQAIERNIPLPNDFLKRNNIDRDSLVTQLKSFGDIKVCVIGDLIIDEYINCHPLGMSREEPTVVVTPIDSMKFLGGAGIVAAHTVGLGAETNLITILGDDSVGQWSIDKASQYGVKVHAIVDKNRPTTLKQRYRSGNHTLLKISHLSQEEVGSSIQKKIVEKFREIAPKTDVLILSDFSYGTFSSDTAQQLIAIARENGILISADSQTSSQIGNLSQFSGVDLITPTEVEARMELKDQSSGLAIIAEKLRLHMNVASILLKLGSDGVLVHGTDAQGKIMATDAIPSLNPNPVDTSGAGDSMLAAASLALAIERNLSKAGLLGSVTAAVQISRTGNIPIEQANLAYMISS